MSAARSSIGAQNARPRASDGGSGPAFTAGTALCFARAIGEFGAVVFIAGNLPGKTEIVSLLIFIRLDEHNYTAAAALAAVLLAAAFLSLLLTNFLQAWQLRYADKPR